MTMEDMVGYDDPCFIISVAARMVGVRTQTMRYYESIGLVRPSRTSGNQRMYSPREVERVRRIRNLMGDLGVNLAGVEVIIRLLDQLQQSERENQELRARVLEFERLLRAHGRA